MNTASFIFGKPVVKFDTLPKNNVERSVPQPIPVNDSGLSAWFIPNKKLVDVGVVVMFTFSTAFMFNLLYDSIYISYVLTAYIFPISWLLLRRDIK